MFSVSELMKIQLKTAVRLTCLFVGGMLVCGCATGDRQASHAVVLDTLESQLYSPESAVAERAALALLSSNSEDAFRTLKTALTEGKSSTARSAAILAFTVQQDSRIRLEAADALGDVNPRTAGHAKRYLVDVIGEKAAGDLLSRARDDSRQVTERVAAIQVVAEYGRRETVEGLIELLEDRSVEIAEAAATALREITYQPFSGDGELWRSWYRQNRGLSREEWREVGQFYYTGLSALEGQIEQLEARSQKLDAGVVELSKRIIDMAVNGKQPQYVLAILQAEVPVDARIYAARKLGAMKAQGAVEPLIDKALSENPRFAEAAILALGEIQAGDPQALVVVASRLKDGDAGVRLAAAKAYGQLPESDPKLLMPLFDDPSPPVRAAVAEAMGRYPWQEAFDRTISALGDPSPDVRAAAAKALGLLKDKAAVPELLKLIDDDVDTVVFETVYSLSQLPDAQAYDALIRASEHDDSRVRELAVVALEKVLALNTRDPRAAIDKFFGLARSDPVPRVNDRAWKAFTTLVGNDPDVLLGYVEHLMGANRFDRAESLLKIVADRNESSEQVIEARRILARAYLEGGNHQGALAYCRRILEQLPEDPEARAGEKKAMEGLGDYRGLAALYARELAGGGYDEDAPARFLDAAEKLVDSEQYKHAVLSIDLVLSSGAALAEDFRESLDGIRTWSLEQVLVRLVNDLAGDEQAHAAAMADLAELGLHAAKDLVGALESPSQPVRTAAIDLLGRMADGDDFGYDSLVDPAAQHEALEAWRAWLAAHLAQ